MKLIKITPFEEQALNSILHSVHASADYLEETPVCEDCGQDPCACEAEDPLIAEGKQLMKELGYGD